METKLYITDEEKKEYLIKKGYKEYNVPCYILRPFCIENCEEKRTINIYVKDPLDFPDDTENYLDKILKDKFGLDKVFRNEFTKNLLSL